MDLTTEAPGTPEPTPEPSAQPVISMNEGGGGSAFTSFDQVEAAQAAKVTPATPVPQWLTESNIPAELHHGLSKFQTPADMANSYSQLQSKLSQTRPAAASLESQPTLQAEGPASQGQQAQGLTITNPLANAAADQSFIERAGFTEQQLVDTFQQHGNLTVDQVTRLQNAGASLADIQNGINGRIAVQQIQQMQTDTMMKEAAGEVGGQEQLDSILDWARDNIPEAEKAVINAQLSNPASFKRAVQHLSRDMAEHTGTATMHNPQGGTNVTASGTTPFPSMQEMSDAMMDKRFDSDPEYTKVVMARAGITQGKRLPQ